jgi:rRNA processing protein Krr1/Pno1
MISISQVFVAGKIAKNANKWPNEIQNVINDVQDNVIKELKESNVNIKIESNGETVEINTSSNKKDKEQKLEDLEAGSTQKDDSATIKK